MRIRFDVGVRDIYVVGRVHRDAARIGQNRRRGGPAFDVSRRHAGHRAYQGSDDSARNFANAAIPAVGDEHVPVDIENDVGGNIERGHVRRVAVMRKARDIIPGKREDDSLRDLSHNVVRGVADVESIRAIQRDGHGLVELRLQGIGIVTCAARLAVAGNRGDDAARDQTNSLVSGIGDVDITRRVDHHPLGPV